jgi:hypothetical protein
MELYPAYFTINGIPIFNKAYSKENNTIYFFGNDGLLVCKKANCSKNYNWPDCKRFFADRIKGSTKYATF